MWWKLIFAVIATALTGAVAVTALLYRSYATVRDVRVDDLSTTWSSSGKDWASFSEWLRLGGRLSLRDAAFTAANNGITEADVRSRLGPPDLVIVGDAEFKSYPAVHMKGASGAYFYKIGRFAIAPGRLGNETFAIVFDFNGRVMYCLGIGVADSDMLAAIDADTRTERRIIG